MSSLPQNRSVIVDPVLGPDRAVALSYVPARKRAAIGALWSIDAAMGDVVRTSREPMVGAIRLAWWRERLEELDSGGPPPAEPRLQAVMAELLPLAISGRQIAVLEGGWLRLFDPFPWETPAFEAVLLRGRNLFGLAARVLGGSGEQVEVAGGAWALVDAARHCSDGASRAALLTQAQLLANELRGARFERAVRPLTMLGALAMRDVGLGEPFELEGSPRRLGVMLAHRMSGRMTRKH